MVSVGRVRGGGGLFLSGPAGDPQLHLVLICTIWRYIQIDFTALCDTDGFWRGDTPRNAEGQQFGWVKSRKKEVVCTKAYRKLSPDVQRGQTQKQPAD